MRINLNNIYKACSKGDSMYLIKLAIITFIIIH